MPVPIVININSEIPQYGAFFQTHKDKMGFSKVSKTGFDQQNEIFLTNENQYKTNPNSISKSLSFGEIIKSAIVEVSENLTLLRFK